MSVIEWLGWRGAIVALAGGVVLAPPCIAAIDCSGTIPASLLNERMATEVVGQSCDTVKATFAQSLGKQASLAAQLRPAYLRKLSTANAAPASASAVQAEMMARDADVARLSAIANAIAAAKAPAAAGNANAASAAAAAAAALSDLVRNGIRLGRDLSAPIAKDTKGLSPVEADSYCRLDHELQFSRKVQGTLNALCLPTQ